ncbi:DUF6220 domain-containing protein [Mesorhizobium sp. CAU 1732]|uniref:DUF6220 domain-containing protein n=1 Tax=Mesorhizobium sp. CAU 1732 TaxID=3140358 RepID=UPI0032614C1B
MENPHDTVTDMHRDLPGWFVWTARLLPIGIFAQFLSAGLGLFLNPDMLGLHGGVGTALSLPVLALLAGALLIRRLRGFGWWAGAVVLLYGVQVGLAAGAAPVPLSLHPANGALLLATSLVLLAKVERRRAPHPGSV